MSQQTGGIRRPLRHAGTYSLLQRALGAQGVYRMFVAQHLKPREGERILDLGCGPAEILALLPASVEYVGVDHSPDYVAAARRRFGDRGRFVCADIRELMLGGDERFDAVISIGVLHHLDDADAGRMVGLAAGLLAESGRLITIDPAFADGQPTLARWLISRDRGRSVRTGEAYRALAERWFRSVSLSLYHDRARVPYTHAILESRRARAGSWLSERP